MNIGDLVFGLRADGAPLQKDATKAGADAGEAGAKSFDKTFSGRIKSMKADLAKGGGIQGALLGGVGLGAGLGAFDLATKGIGMVVDAAGEAINAASDLAESQSKVNVVFGDNAQIITDWSATAAKSMGMTQQAALEAAGTFGNLFSALGLTQDATVDMSKSAVQLAADLGSFHNTSADEALLAIKSGLLGEAEPMRKFGAILSEARVQAYGVASGMIKAKGVMTDAQKVQARYALILKDTKNAQGDLVRTSDGLAGSTKITNAEMGDLQARIGTGLLPWVKELTKAALVLVDAVDAVGDSFNQWAVIGDKRLADIDKTMLQGLADAGRWLDMTDLLARALGETADQFNNELNARLADGTLTQEQAIAQVWEEVKGNRFVAAAKDAGQTLGTAAADAIVEPLAKVPDEVHEALKPTPDTVRQALDPITDEVQGVLKKTRQGINKGMGDIMWSLEHPLTEANLKKKYRDAIHGGTVAMNRALKEGNAAALAKAQKFVHDMQVELNKLSDADWALWLTGQVKAGRPKGELRPGRAAGGPVTRGMPYIVGERRPELFVPDTNGTILPSVGGGSSRVDFYVHDPDGGIAKAGQSPAQWATALLAASQSAGARYSTPRR